MGRLFWKFFLSILLAQVAATIGIGGTIWLRDQARQRNTEPMLDLGPPAMIMLDAAAATLRHGGVDALRDLATNTRRMRLYVLDDQGRELLGRTVPAKLRGEVERNLEAGTQTHAVARLTAPDGRRYLAFASRTPFPHQGGDGPRPGFSDGSKGVSAGSQTAQASSFGPGHGPSIGPGPGGPGGGWSWFGLPPEFGRHVGRSLPIAAATLASFLFAALLAWYFSRPIRALRGAFEAAAAGDLAPKFGEARKAVAGDELAELGHDFDRMSAQLRTLMEGQRRLLHDVSHELRSPLARLQAAIGLAHQQPDRIATSLERIERESVRMDKLVGELLTLSRLEANPDLPKNELVDMQELVDGIALDARFEAGDDGPTIEVEIEGEPQATVRGAPDLLWRAVENVVRNAVKHGGAGGRVDIRLYARGPLVHVDVLDRGPGILDADLPTVFEPFFRSNPGKNNIDGHGLGLAIAQRVVHAHGGTIVARNRDGGGLQVAIALPLAA